MEEVKVRCLLSNFGDIKFYTFSMKVQDVVNIHYVAVRGRDSEEGSVQRVLNKQRIKSVKDFILKGDMFFNTFILNWTEEEFVPQYNENENTFTVPLRLSAAQVIDGQHRLAGLEEAIKDDISIGEKEILVSMAIGLSTKEAAAIFLNINTEQKPVPKSLIYDLYGVIEENNTDLGIVRATDIANELNENSKSPYYKTVKFPGAPRGFGTVDLSTVVSSLKNHLEVNGTFAKYNLKDLNRQKQALLNYFTAIQFFYEKAGYWSSKSKNPFLRNSGFNGAIEFFVESLIPKCSEKKSFSVDTIKSLMELDSNDLLMQNDIKSMDGKSARKRVVEFLESGLLKSLPHQDDYEF